MNLNTPRLAGMRHAAPLSAALVALALLGACTGSADTGPDSSSTAGTAEVNETITELEDGTQFIVRIMRPGSGDAATAGDSVSVHYTGWLFDPTAADNRGSKFDSSRDRGAPFSFPLGARRVIAGWDQGVEGMQVGELRELIIPPTLGYGDRGAGGVIPPGATLYFEVELLAIN